MHFHANREVGLPDEGNTGHRASPTVPRILADAGHCLKERSYSFQLLTGRPAAARGARKRRPGLCALEGRFQRGFVQCRPHPVYKPPFEQGRQCTKSGRPLRAWSCTETAPSHAGPGCAEIGEKRTRQGSVQPKSVHDLPAAQTSAMSCGFRGRGQVRTFAAIPSDPRKVQKSHKRATPGA